MKMRILAVGAHPDDVEILCSGTLARYTAQGHQVVMAHACRGDKGHGEILHHQVGVVRDKEAQAAARVIGAEAMSLDFLDGELYVNEASMIRFVDMIRMVKPDLMITHHPTDYHGDHNAVTKLVLDASFLATLPYYVTAHPLHPVTPPIYFMDTLAGIDFTPTEYVDISATVELKKQAMAQHVSQITWLKDHHHTDILDFIETMARFRGLQCGARYAEGFQPFRAWGRISSERLLP
jgi:LmbE family N-acetylglucosaminyl deacetylase